MISFKERANTWLAEHLPRISADTLGWLAVILIHCATIPTLLALLTGLSDNVPNLDIVLFMWAGLVLLFVRSVVMKDALYYHADYVNPQWGKPKIDKIGRHIFYREREGRKI